LTELRQRLGLTCEQKRVRAFVAVALVAWPNDSALSHDSRAVSSSNRNQIFRATSSTENAAQGAQEIRDAYDVDLTFAR
jgi:hypothetical protein